MRETVVTYAVKEHGINYETLQDDIVDFKKLSNEFKCQKKVILKS